MNPKITAEEKTQQADSIDSIFSQISEDKAKAMDLLNRGSLNLEELRFISKTIYQDVFKYAINFRNSHDPMVDLIAEVKSFFTAAQISGKDTMVYLVRLARPAFWFASKKVWKTEFKHYNSHSLGTKDHFNWTPQLNLNDYAEEFFKEYCSEFDSKYAEYYMANLKQLLD